MSIGQFRTWFHFKVSGVPAGQTLIFTIRQMNFQNKLYQAGLKPVYKVQGQMKAYKRVTGEVSTNVRIGMMIIVVELS